MTMREWDELTAGMQLDLVDMGGRIFRQGGHVRLRPRPGADIMDLALAGMDATIESIEQDFENKIYLAVTIDDDPGKDLGAMRLPGHRFFFSPAEVELPGETMGGAA